MPDLIEKLHELDRFQPPEVWTEIQDRALGSREGSEALGPSAVRRSMAVVLAAALTIAGLLLVDRAFKGDGSGLRPAGAPSLPDNGSIAFGCGYHICTISPDGTGITDLIEAYDREVVVAAYAPVWSPDGTKIAFRGYDREGSSSGGGANYDVYVMNADGSGLRNLTKSPEDVARRASQFSPEWSADGTMLAFGSDDGDRDGIYVVNVDGRGLERIAGGSFQAWSPTENRILFTARGSSGQGLFTIAPDGSGSEQLTDPTGWDGLASWSPDGSQIAFVRGEEGTTSVYVMSSDGSGERSIFHERGIEPYEPLWSPDGTRLVFEAQTRADSDLYIVNADGSGWMALTSTDDRSEVSPTWSPDGTLIAFRATTETTSDTADYPIYLIRPDGSNEELLTSEGGYSLDWQAIGGGRLPA
jgi:TolB protein